MNRRKFFNLFGSAIIGTAIALKLPDFAVPRIIEWRDRLTIGTLFTAWEDCIVRNELHEHLPRLIVVNENTYDYIVNGILPRINTKKGTFFGTEIKESIKWEQMQDGDVNILGVYYGNCGRFKFQI